MSEKHDFAAAAAGAQKIIDNIERVIIGKRREIAGAVGAMLAGGHILIEDVPGVGKTMLAKALAKSIAGEYKRIQFTSDLLPSDITGVNIFNQKAGSFEFRAGPVFANVLLGDEINRATPRTQSSLLEAMEEQQVSVDGSRYPLAVPFLVIATQNPIELEGTYPLPFAQMDRFMVRLRLGYLDAARECEMVRLRLTETPVDTLRPVLDCAALVSLQQAVRDVIIAPELLGYIVTLVQETRRTAAIEFGASPRAGLDLARFSQAMALAAGRGFVLPDDVKAAAPLVLAHRIIVKRGTRHATAHATDLIDELLQTVPVPV